MHEAQDGVQKTKRQLEEEHIPLWIKLFGGTIISITFLCLVTVTGYFVNNMSSLQNQLNVMAAESISKSMWDQNVSDTKSYADAIVNCKERLNAIEQLAKERAVLLEKSNDRIESVEQDTEMINKELATQKEKFLALEHQFLEEREENRQVAKDLQLLRERIAGVEGKAEKPNK